MRPASQHEDSVAHQSSSFAIIKLRDDGSNWPDYEMRAKTAMGAKGLIRHIEGTARQPLPFDVENGQPVMEPGKLATRLEIQDLECAMDDFEQKEYAARHIMLTTVSPRLSTMLRANTSAAQMWQQIILDATKKSRVHQVDTRRHLQELRCPEGGDVRAHLNAMTDLHNELEGIGAPVNNEDFATMIHVSLPLSYRPLLQSVLHAADMNEKAVDPNYLIRIVLEENHQRQITHGLSKSGQAAFQTNKNRRRGKGNKSSGQTKQCENCKRTNHNTEDCFAKGGPKEGQRPPWAKNKQTEANAAATKRKKEEMDEWVAFTCTSTPTEVAAKATHQCSHVTAFLDSGATAHFTPLREKLINFWNTSPRPVTAADGGEFNGVGCGDMPLEVINGLRTTKLLLKNVIYSPKLAFTLISIGRLDDSGCMAMFGQGHCTIRHSDGRELACVKKTNGLYQLNGTMHKHGPLHANVATQWLSLTEAHRTLGHINVETIKHAIKTGKITGITLNDGSEPEFCDACMQAKPHCQPFPDQAQNRVHHFGDRIHMDLWGPATVESILKSQYTVDFINCATRWTHVAFLRHKNEAFQAYLDFEKWLETQDSVRIKILRSDCGHEFLNDKFSEHLADKGTIRELTIHDRQEQVGIAECS